MTDTPTAPIRVANCSGFFGDRLSGAVEMVEGGPIDVLTGDWLAELTMLILSRVRAKHPGQGFARTFVTQMEQVMGTCLDRGIKVVSNAGGLDPGGCADAVAEVADRLGLAPRIAYVDGDDLMPRLADLVTSGTLEPLEDGNPTLAPFDATTEFLTANAYLGCWGIVEALDAGADIVITGRVTDAAVACGPAAWRHRWARTDLDQLAGAVVAGHLIECSAQVTGGNYSFFTEVPGIERLGFPWAEIAADGSSVIGKHPGTGGLISTGTVTSQLLYEIGGPRYLGPDVTTRLDSIRLEQLEPDRVRVSGVVGEAPPSTLKVATNRLGGYRNEMTVALTGLDIDAKAVAAQAAIWELSPTPPDGFDSITIDLLRTDQPDPTSNEAATASLRITVKDRDERKVGRAFTNSVVETALASIPGFYALSGPPGPARPYGVYQPGVVPAELVPAYVHFDGNVAQVDSAYPAPSAMTAPGSGAAAGSDIPTVAGVADVAEDADVVPPAAAPDGPTEFTAPDGPTEFVALGTIVGARSGDKGGNANLGVFVRDAAAYGWLREFLTTDRLRQLLPEITTLPVERYELANLWALNFVICGLLDEGVAAASRTDGQAKSLGEWLRARVVPIPTSLL